MSAIMGGIKAGIIIGLVAGILGGALQVVGSIPILGFCVCFVLPLTWALAWFLFPLGTGLLSGMFAKSEIKSIVDGAIGGAVGGAIYAILSWIIGFVVGIVLLIFWQVINILLTAGGGGKLDIGAIVMSVVAAFLGNILSTLVGLAIVFGAGLLWGIVGGIAYALLFAKPK